MLITSPTVTRAEFEAGTGWQLKPEGACRGEVCIPLADPPAADGPDSPVDVASLADQMGLPLVADEASGIAALGPASIGARTLVTAEAPELVLPDLDGNDFALSSLRGTKVLLVAWSPY